MSSQECKSLEMALIPTGSQRLWEVGESLRQVGENSRGEGGVPKGSGFCSSGTKGKGGGEQVSGARVAGLL